MAIRPWHALDIELSKIFVATEVLSICLHHGNPIDTLSRGRDSNTKPPAASSSNAEASVDLEYHFGDALDSAITRSCNSQRPADYGRKKKFVIIIVVSAFDKLGDRVYLECFLYLQACPVHIHCTRFQSLQNGFTT